MSQDYQSPYFATRTLPPDVFYLHRMNQQQPRIARKTQLILDHDINYSDEIDELVDHDMFHYLEPPTYYYAHCVKDQLRRRNAVVLPAHEEIVEEEEEEEEDEFEDEEIVEEEEEEKFEVEISSYNAFALDIDEEEEQEVCAICLLEYKDENIVRTLQCGHEFHAGCVNNNNRLSHR
uniref:RING-type E3 ubiquitin transferase n=1 Tax=Nicotiana sylvestris TaxID=4096 RepID=A0A1U7VGC1_NICSY|nr:PREDICTED: nucleomorphin-like [Nicotiana sylvestris]